MFARRIALVALLLITLATSASTQTPYIGVFFDPALSSQLNFMSCQQDVFETWYVAMFNANAFVAGVEYKIAYPSEVIWIADLELPHTAIGTTPSGISIGFPAPLNGFSPVVLHTVLMTWNCQFCTQANRKIDVMAHPLNPDGKVQWSDWPAFDLHEAIGTNSLICVFVATEASTWGRVKALYQR